MSSSHTKFEIIVNVFEIFTSIVMRKHIPIARGEK